MRALAVTRSSQVSQSKDATGSGTRVSASVAVSRRRGSPVRPPRAAEPLTDATEASAVSSRRSAEGEVRGHERLVAPVGVREERPFGSTGPQRGQQPPYGGRFEERQVGRENHDGLGCGVAQARVERGDRARAGRLLARPADRPGGGPRVRHDDGGPGVRAGGEHPVEQRPAAHAEAGFVGAPEPAGGATGEHDGVVGGVVSGVGGSYAVTPEYAAPLITGNSPAPP